MEEEQIEKIEAEESVVKEEKVEKEPKLEKADILKVLANALKVGTISKEQHQQMRMELGVTQSDFTSKQVSATVRKKKRKAQKVARKITRQNGFKGQKVTKGHASARGG